MHMTANPSFIVRDRVLARVTIALLAGFLVRIGAHVFALRDAGETIDDGEQLLEACADGLFERYEGFKTLPGGGREPSRHWCMVYQGGSPRPMIRRALAELDDTAIEMLQVSLTVAGALSKAPEIGEALRTGVRLVDPPTQILGDEHGSPSSPSRS